METVNRNVLDYILFAKGMVTCRNGQSDREASVSEINEAGERLDIFFNRYATAMKLFGEIGNLDVSTAPPPLPYSLSLEGEEHLKLLKIQKLLGG